MANWATIDRLGNPADPAWQQKNLTWIEPVPGQKWQVYGGAAQAFEGLLSDLAKEGYPLKSSGGFNYRNIRGGSKLSQHAFGTAIDLNAATNPMLSRGQAVVTDLPSNIGDLAAKHGLEWGGNWSRPDAMHFEWRGGNVPAPTSLASSFTPAQAGTTEAPAAKTFGDVVAPAQAGQGASAPQQAFGDMIAPQAPISFANIIDSYAQRRRAAEEEQQARQARLAALFAELPA